MWSILVGKQKHNVQKPIHRAISLTGFKLWATTPNNMKQVVQMDSTC